MTLVAAFLTDQDELLNVAKLVFKGIEVHSSAAHQAALSVLPGATISAFHGGAALEMLSVCTSMPLGCWTPGPSEMRRAKSSPKIGGTKCGERHQDSLSFRWAEVPGFVFGVWVCW